MTRQEATDLERNARELQEYRDTYQEREGARKHTQALYNTLETLGLSDRGEVIDPPTPEEHAAGMKNGAALLRTLRKMEGDY